MARTRVSVPETARKGEVIQVKTLISHRMETGNRRDKATGNRIPRQIIKKFICTYNGKEILSTEWYPAVAANPYLAFYTVATESGSFEFTWIDDDGTVYTHTANITVY